MEADGVKERKTCPCLLNQQLLQLRVICSWLEENRLEQQGPPGSRMVEGPTAVSNSFGDGTDFNWQLQDNT